MFVLIWIKFNQFSLRTRLLAGLSVSFIFILVTLACVFRIFYFDDFIRYTSKDTALYFQADLNSGTDNFYKVKLIETLLNQYDLSGLNRHLIGRKIAVICDEYKNDLNCGLIIKIDNTPEIIKNLSANQIGFRQFRADTIIISDNDDWLLSVKKSHNPFRYFKYQSAIFGHNSLTLAVNQPKILTSELSKIIYLANLSDFSKLIGDITPSGLIFQPARQNKLFSANNKQKPDDSANNCDIYINSAGGINSQSSILSPLLIKPFNLCLNRINSAGDTLNDYKFSIISNGLPDSSENTVKLEIYLLSLASLMQPAQKTYYLKDGTKISELYRDNKTLVFISATGTRSILLASGRSLNYSTSSGKLIIGNQELSSIKTKFSTSSADFARIRINSLPSGQIKKLLSEFSYLIMSNNQLTIK